MNSSVQFCQTLLCVSNTVFVATLQVHPTFDASTARTPPCTGGVPQQLPCSEPSSFLTLLLGPWYPPASPICPGAPATGLVAGNRPRKHLNVSTHVHFQLDGQSEQILEKWDVVSTLLPLHLQEKTGNKVIYMRKMQEGTLLCYWN